MGRSLSYSLGALGRGKLETPQGRWFLGGSPPALKMMYPRTAAAAATGAGKEGAILQLLLRFMRFRCFANKMAFLQMARGSFLCLEQGCIFPPS